MTLRPILAIAFLASVALVDAYLLWTEQIAPSESQARHTALREDPLLGLKYSAGNREVNMVSFGLEAAAAARAVDRIRDLEDRYKDKLAIMLKDAPMPTELADALCGQTREVRPHYGALRFLVEDVAGERQTIRLQRVTVLEEQEWAKVSPILAVYDEVELAEERQKDATVMAIAAILLGKEEEVLNNYAPWGRGLAGTWSWKKVTKENPGIEEKVVEYFAVLHLVVEMAMAEGGICGQ
jgi:hypothetical protein